MALALDTNLFIYAHFSQYTEHGNARSFLESLLTRPDPFYITWQVYYEYIRIVTHPKVHSKPLSVSQACHDLSPYLNDSRCHILTETQHHHDAIQVIFKMVPKAKSNFIHDCHYAALLYEHGIKEIVTADMDFKKFDFLNVVNPF